jgi:hypothetical protein
MEAHPLGEITRGSEPGTCLAARHRPHGFHPVQLLLRGWEEILATEVASIGSLSCIDGALELLVECLVRDPEEFGVSGSVRDRLSSAR